MVRERKSFKREQLIALKGEAFVAEIERILAEQRRGPRRPKELKPGQIQAVLDWVQQPNPFAPMGRTSRQVLHLYFSESPRARNRLLRHLGSLLAGEAPTEDGEEENGDRPRRRGRPRRAVEEETVPT